MQSLQNIFQKFRHARLRMSPEKCNFFLPRISFLGFEVSQDGLRVNPQRFDAISSYPAAKTPKEVRSLLGVYGYFRKFVPRYSQITSCLRDLLTKQGSANFAWNQEHDAALQTLKDELLRNGTLNFPDLDKQFTIWIDSCKTGLSYALSQAQPDGKHLFV